MKAMLLAAGESSRLPEARTYGSKVLVPVRGKTILERNLLFLKRAGIRQVVINLSSGKEKILEFLERRRVPGLSLAFSFEREPLGTAGGVKKARRLLGKKDFLVWYGDNLSDFDVRALARFHHKQKALATLGIFHSRRTKHSGILAGFVKVGPQGTVEKFIEKRNNQKAGARSYVNAGVAVFSSAIFRLIPSGKFCDFAKDVYPALLKKRARLLAAEGATYVLASDTPAALKRTRRLAAEVL